MKGTVAAAEAIPTPKSWANLKADGTPEEAKRKAKRKATVKKGAKE